MNNKTKDKLNRIKNNLLVAGAFAGAITFLGVKLSHDNKLVDNAEKKLLTGSNILANKYNYKLTDNQKVVAVEACARDLYLSYSDKHGMANAFLTEPEVTNMSLVLREKLPEYKNKASDDLGKFQLEYLQNLSSFMGSNAPVESKRAVAKLITDIAKNGVVKTMEGEGVSYSGFTTSNKTANNGDKPLNLVLTSMQKTR